MKTIDQATEEIKEIVKKYDLAAMICLVDPETRNFVNEFSPSWSCAKFNEETGELRIKALASDFPDRESHKKVITDTTSMIMTFLQQAEQNVDNMMLLVQMLGKYFDMSHIEKPRNPNED